MQRFALFPDALAPASAPTGAAHADTGVRPAHTRPGLGRGSPDC